MEQKVIVKIARHKEANFKNEMIQVANINSFIKTRKVIEYGICSNIEYIIMDWVEGYRLSEKLEDYNRKQKEYCINFGRNIGLIHSQNVSTNKTIDRTTYDLCIPNYSNVKHLSILEWLSENKPTYINECFVHGDHHYANIIWQKNEINCVLDWELSGIGNKELDLAWAIVRRPKQNFFIAKEEEDWILEGYSQNAQFEYTFYSYYYVLCSMRFFKIAQDESYRDWLLNKCESIIRSLREL